MEYVYITSVTYFHIITEALFTLNRIRKLNVAESVLDRVSVTLGMLLLEQIFYGSRTTLLHLFLFTLYRINFAMLRFTMRHNVNPAYV